LIVGFSVAQAARRASDADTAMRASEERPVKSEPP
jgi:hypothetical protein